MTIFADTILHFSELSLPEETIHGEKKFVKTSYVPLGVVAAIGPWNCMTLSCSCAGEDAKTDHF